MLPPFNQNQFSSAFTHLRPWVVRRLVPVLAAACLSSLAPVVAAGTDTALPSTGAAALAKVRTPGIKSRAKNKFYDRQFDLSGLPEYRPLQQVSGTLRQWGNNYLKDSGLIGVWEKAFRQFHPTIRFEDKLVSSAVAFPGLISGAADLAPMGRQASWDELRSFERERADASNAGSCVEVLEIIVATGSFDVRGWTFALGVFVHKDNPISQLTMDQLDGIFGAERSGGWNGLTWDTSVARGPEKNIRTWGQLGLTGEWADKPINVYGYNFKCHFTDEFDRKVLKGSGKWNERLKIFANAAGLKPGGTLTGGGELMMSALSNDRYGIAYTGMPFLTPQTKSVDLAAQTGGPYIGLTLENVQNRSFPLARGVYYYLKREKNRPVDPKVKEFLRYLLSREGQDAIQRDAKYLPLTADAAREQLKKLE
ncbi:MAG: substrate-binding domain-containing protein [Opitutaceae bacterium]|nr:substrate-binding domain-containing protein [Opitutaceae bacterium]